MRRTPADHCVSVELFYLSFFSTNLSTGIVLVFSLKVWALFSSEVASTLPRNAFFSPASRQQLSKEKSAQLQPTQCTHPHTEYEELA